MSQTAGASAAAASASMAAMAKYLAETPALPPPPGVMPNLIAPPAPRAPWIIFTLSLCAFLGTVFIIMRLFTVFRVTKAHGWADYTAFMSYLGSMGYVAIGFVELQYGAGKHQWNVSIANVEQYGKVINVIEIMYGPILFVTKLSILLQYRRIFDSHRTGKTHYLIHIVIWLNALFYLADTFVEAFACLPREKLWVPTVPGKCINILANFVVSAAINMVSDFIILGLPLYKIYQMRMEPRKKIGVAAIFTVGLFACISSIMRLVMTVKYTSNPDLTYNLVPLALWTDAEITSALLCSCAPAFPAFYRRFLPQLSLNRSRKSPHAPVSPPGVPSPNEKHSPTANVSTIGGGHKKGLWAKVRDPHSLGFAKTTNMTGGSGGSKVGLTQVSQGTMVSSSGGGEGDGDGNRMGSWDVEKGARTDLVEHVSPPQAYEGEGQGGGHRRHEHQAIGVASWA